MGQEIYPMIPKRTWNEDGTLTEVEYHCPHCNKWNSKKGILEHIGHDWYRCKKCGRKFSRRDILNSRKPECPPNKSIIG